MMQRGYECLQEESAPYRLRLANKAILDLTDLNLVTKRANLVAGFFKIREISVFKAKYLISRV
jgi:hypothetical protein